MKQNTRKWLILSFVILLILPSCKKKKGVLDDFDSGRFDFVCIWNKNGIQDTLTGEVTGPYTHSMKYYFTVRQAPEAPVKSFWIGGYEGMMDGQFSSQGLWSLSGNISYPPAGLWISGKITYEEHDSDHLMVSFQSKNDTISGLFKLTRKQ